MPDELDEPVTAAKPSRTAAANAARAAKAAAAKAAATPAPAADPAPAAQPTKAAIFPQFSTNGNFKDLVKELGGKAVNGVAYIPRSAIHVMPGYNVRNFDDPTIAEHLDNIERSITQHGFYPDKPLAIHVGVLDGKNVAYLTDGETRLLASGRAAEKGVKDLDMLPVVPKAAGFDLEAATYSLIAGNEGRPLTTLEKAVAVDRLQSLLVDEQTIARRLGVTPRHINDLMTLNGGPDDVKDRVRSGKISATLAIEELRRSTPEKVSARVAEAQAAATAAGRDKVTKKDLPPVPASESKAKTRAGKAAAAATPGKPTGKGKSKPPAEEVLLRRAIELAVDGNDMPWLTGFHQGAEEPWIFMEKDEFGLKEGVLSEMRKGYVRRWKAAEARRNLQPDPDLDTGAAPPAVAAAAGAAAAGAAAGAADEL